MSASKTARPQQRRRKTVATRFAGTFVAAMSMLLMASAVAEAHIGTPRLQSPRSKLVVSSLPAFEWSAVGRAASYQFEFSATRNFSSNVSGFGTNPVAVNNTAISNDDTIPNGTYFWRVRGVSATNVPGSWSPIRKLVKRWNAAPKLKTPAKNGAVNWPSNPLLFSWSPVAGAVNYQLKIGTSPQMSTLVSGPTDVQGPRYAFPGALAPNTYYWSVAPIDASGNLGKQSAVGKFTWNWPSQTTLTETDVSPDTSYEEPNFSWTPVPGAASYEVQVATLSSYPTNAIILDAGGLTATTYTATSFFPDHTTLYWRMRAIDANGDAGTWNNGQPFTEAFDQESPSIANLHLYDQGGNVLPAGTTTQAPILRWSPVPGASDYRLTLAVWSSTAGCLYNGSGTTATITTPSTSWAPEGEESLVNGNGWENTEYGWPGAADNSNSWIGIIGNAGVCVSVIAERHDGPLAGSTIESAPTLMGDNATPAFVYDEPGSHAGTLGVPNSSTYSLGIIQPAAGSPAAGANATVPTTPMFEWQPVANADGYYVVVANSQNFSPNSIVTGGYVQDTTWTPSVELNDQSASYWWEVIPVALDQYDGQPALNPEDPGSYDPQPFNKSSVPPSPVSPVNGGNVPTQPTFSWQSAAAAVNYTLEISADSTFANPIQTITTDNTSYTTTSTLPAGKTLYWRVRTNDLSNNLNWSPTRTFTHNLPAPSWASVPKTGFAIPLLSWSPVTGAIGYNLQITNGGQSSIVPVNTPNWTPSEFLNPGINHLQLQSVFPGNIASAFSSVATYNRTLPSPGGIRASKHGTRILIKWKTDPLAKEYDVQLSTTTGFGSPVSSDSTENSAWVPQISAADAHLRLYWRLAAVDNGNNVGAWHSGVFNGKHAKSTKHKKHKTKKKHKK
jgi:hypothetical protein